MDTQSLLSGALPPLVLALPAAPVWPDPDPNVFECDSYHPPDTRQPIFMGYAAGPTPCRVEWVAFDLDAPPPHIPPGNASEATWASVYDAYEKLPNPLAVETLILAHVGLAHWIVEKMADQYYPDAMRLERGEPKRYASIAEDWFSMALLKMLRVIVGDRKRKKGSNTRGLRRIGEKHGWHAPEVNVPKQIAKYFGKVIWTEIWQSYKKEQAARRHTIAYLLTRQSHRKGARIKLGEIEQDEQDEQEEEVSCDSGPCVAFHEETPERIAAVNEALNRAVAECAKARALAKYARGRTLDDGEREKILAGCDTFDIIGRLLLTMKRENSLSEWKMGEQVGLSRDQVQRRLQGILGSMETDLELRHDADEQSKRVARKPLPVLSAKDAFLGLLDGDLIDQLLTQVRDRLLSLVEMAARLGWTRDQLERRLCAMREADRGWAKKHDFLDALIAVAD